MLLFTIFEMPYRVKKSFLKIPVWISSSVIAFAVGTVGRGVLGPASGFMTELLLFPGLYFTKKHFEWKENRKKENECISIKKISRKNLASSPKMLKSAS